MRKSQMKLQRSWKKAVNLCLAGVLAVSLMGCGAPAGDKSGLGGAGSKSGDASDKDIAMGRYVETMIDVDSKKIMDLQELSDSRLVLLENGAKGRWISEDGGATWNPDELPGWYDLVKENYICDMKAAPDGSVAILYQGYGNIRGMKDEGVNAIMAELAKSCGICLISAQGEEKQIALSFGEEEVPHRLCFSEDGSRLFAASSDKKIYEIDREAGTAKFFLAADIMPDLFCVWENYMALKNECEGVVLYQLDTMEQIEDDVITDFVKKN